MNTLADRVRTAVYQRGHVIVTFESDVEIRFPITGNPRLEKGTSTQLGKVEISPFGLHWEELDEDLSFKGIMEGDYGQTRTSNADRVSKQAVAHR